MEFSARIITLAAVILSVLICEGFCITCFDCNSANSSACLDFHKYDPETLARIIPVVECNRSPIISNQRDIKFFCRKIMQTIYHTHREPEVRVTRGCGWIPNENNKECYHIHYTDHKDTACQCFSDRCNSADSADPTSSVILFLVFAAVLYFYR